MSKWKNSSSLLFPTILSYTTALTSHIRAKTENVIAGSAFLKSLAFPCEHTLANCFIFGQPFSYKAMGNELQSADCLGFIIISAWQQPTGLNKMFHDILDCLMLSILLISFSIRINDYQKTCPWSEITGIDTLIFGLNRWCAEQEVHYFFPFL